MLSAALARCSRGAFPSRVAHLPRFNSTVNPFSSNVAPESVKSSKDAAESAKKTGSTPADSEFSDVLSQEDESMLQEMEKEISLAGITEADLEPGLKAPQKAGETETEIFGVALSSTGPLDPAALPLRLELDASKVSFTEEQYAATLVHGRSLYTPFFHPRTHSIPVANVHFRSHNPQQLEFFTHFATHAASALGIPISRPYTLPTKRTLWTVPRSPFAHKKSQENFERRVHKRGIKAWDADSEVVERWVRYLRKHAMGGVGMRITRWERLPLGVGACNLAAVDASFLKEGQDSTFQRTEEIKRLSEKIVKAERVHVEESPET